TPFNDLRITLAHINTSILGPEGRMEARYETFPQKDKRTRERRRDLCSRHEYADESGSATDRCLDRIFVYGCRYSGNRLFSERSRRQLLHSKLWNPFHISRCSALDVHLAGCVDSYGDGRIPGWRPVSVIRLRHLNRAQLSSIRLGRL